MQRDIPLLKVGYSFVSGQFIKFPKCIHTEYYTKEDVLLQAVFVSQDIENMGMTEINWRFSLGQVHCVVYWNAYLQDLA